MAPEGSFAYAESTKYGFGSGIERPWLWRGLFIYTGSLIWWKRKS